MNFVSLTWLTYSLFDELCAHNRVNILSNERVVLSQGLHIMMLKYYTFDELRALAE